MSTRRLLNIALLFLLPVSPGLHASQWNQWRGPNRQANEAILPEKLDAVPLVLWSQKLQGDALSGLVATEKHLIVADRDVSDTRDIFLCYSADSGEEIWKFDYFAPGQIDRDYGSAPRSTPLIHGDKVYTLGGFGHLHCLELASGKPLWKKDLALHFSAKMPKWGYSGSPLFVAKNPSRSNSRDKLILQPGGMNTQMVALNPETGDVIWTSPDAKRDAAYSSPILVTFSGVEQLICYDQLSLGGWDVETGKRLWELQPPRRGDFNVSTPVVVGDKLFLTTENNGARLYGFDQHGNIVPEPLADNRDLSPDSSTAVYLDGKLYGVHNDLHVLDAKDLKTVASLEDDAFYEYCTLIAGKTREGKKRLLVTSANGEIVLLDLETKEPRILGRITGGSESETTVAHPALCGQRLYVRTVSAVYCYLLQ